MEAINTGALEQQSLIYRYGREVNAHDVIKIVALILMFIDHYSYFILKSDGILRFIGHVGLPPFFFLIGYAGKIRIRPRLIVYGIVLSYIFTITSTEVFALDILANLLLTHFVLKLFPLEKTSPVIFIGLVIALFTINSTIYPYMEYGSLGILIALAARWTKASKTPLSFLFLAFVLGLYFFCQHTVFPGIFATALQAIIAYSLVGVILLVTFFFYRDVSFPGWPSWLKKFALVISRYSLDIYFWHMLILQIYFWNRVLPMLIFKH